MLALSGCDSLIWSMLKLKSWSSSRVRISKYTRFFSFLKSKFKMEFSSSSISKSWYSRTSDLKFSKLWSGSFSTTRAVYSLNVSKHMCKNSMDLATRSGKPVKYYVCSSWILTFFKLWKYSTQSWKSPWTPSKFKKLISVKNWLFCYIKGVWKKYEFSDKSTYISRRISFFVFFICFNIQFKTNFNGEFSDFTAKIILVDISTAYFRSSISFKLCRIPVCIFRTFGWSNISEYRMKSFSLLDNLPIWFSRVIKSKNE